ncbi:monocarboxylate transporter 10-like [Ptychodera flava]|uniref:monocarboxylate transporter 10-like n=1 Tax=Ptychodera flava TaxID=63121 RepID=UPI003969EA98
MSSANIADDLTQEAQKVEVGEVKLQTPDSECGLKQGPDDDGIGKDVSKEGDRATSEATSLKSPLNSLLSHDEQNNHQELPSSEVVHPIESKQNVATETDKPLIAGTNAPTSDLTDGGRSWMACFASFVICTLNLGIHNSFGVFFVALLDQFENSGAETAWVGSLSYGISLGFSPMATYASARFGHRAVAATGGALCSVGLLFSSFVPNLGVLFLTYSVMFGIGTSFIYTIAIISNSQYFSKHRCLATGIVSAGGSFGTLVMTPFSQYLVSTYGWRRAWRIECALLAVTFVATLSYRSRVRSSSEPTTNVPASSIRTYITDFWIWKDRVFWVWTAAMSLIYMEYYLPYVHLIKFSELHGVSANDGAMLICYLGIATTIGRIVFGKLCDVTKVNRVYIDQASMLIGGVATLLLPLATEYPWMVVYVVCYGFADSIFTTLLPVITQDLVGAERMTDAWGIMLAFCSVAYTLGPPIAGWIYDARNSYDLAFYFAGSLSLIGALLLFLLPVAKKSTVRSVSKKQSADVVTNVTYFENPTYESQTATEPAPVQSTSTAQDRYSIECFDVISLKSEGEETPPAKELGEAAQSSVNPLIEECDGSII